MNMQTRYSASVAETMALEITARHFQYGDGIEYMERRETDKKGHPYRVYDDARIVQMAMNKGASPNLTRAAANAVILRSVRRNRRRP